MLSFFSSRRIGTPPTPRPQASVSPPPFGSGGRGTLAGERGGGSVPIPTRGHTLWYSVNIRTLWVKGGIDTLECGDFYSVQKMYNAGVGMDDS